MKKFIIFSFLIFAILRSEANLPEIFDQITESIKAGDMRALSSYFNSTIDLTVGSQENSYSKAQAEQILRDFFSNNKPSSFSIIHQGFSKEGARYAIGSLITSQGKSFRVYLYIKQIDGIYLVNELRFMPE